MRELRQMPHNVTWPSLHDSNSRLLGLPFVLAACTPGLVVPWSACFAAVMVASLATFLVYVPMTALALNGGAALRDDAPAPALTPRAYGLLLLLWTTTAWLGAVAAPHLGSAG